MALLARRMTMFWLLEGAKQLKKIRLDQLIFGRGLLESREKAKALIMSGAVLVDGERVDKAGAMVDPDCEIKIKSFPYVILLLIKFISLYLLV